MIGWIILGILLLVFTVVLLTPVRVRAVYEKGGLTVRVRYGLMKLQLFPLEKKEPKSEKKKKSKPEKAKPENKRKPKAKINRQQILYTLEKLPPVLGKALRRVGRRVILSPLKVSLLVAGTDPADTAQLYGQLVAALANGLPVLQKAVHIREQDIRLYPDFAGSQMDCAADVGVSIRPWDALVIAVCAGASLVRWLLGFRKLASPPPAPEPEQTEETEQSETTAA